MTLDNPNIVDFPNAQPTKRLDEVELPPVNDLARYKDKINPDHYKTKGAECIEITEHMNFCLGNVVKYCYRCDEKGGLEDLRKARWYLDREITRREAAQAPKDADGYHGC